MPAINAASILDNIRKLRDKAQLGAYLDVLLRTNPKAFMEAENMARRGLPTLEEALTEVGFLPRFEEYCKEKGRREEKQNIINLLKSGKSAEEIIQLMENGIVGTADYAD